MRHRICRYGPEKREDVWCCARAGSLPTKLCSNTHARAPTHTRYRNACSLTVVHEKCAPRPCQAPASTLLCNICQYIFRVVIARTCTARVAPVVGSGAVFPYSVVGLTCVTSIFGIWYLVFVYTSPACGTARNIGWFGRSGEAPSLARMLVPYPR